MTDDDLIYRRMKDFRQIYQAQGAYHHQAQGFKSWFLVDNYQAIADQCHGKKHVLDLACGEGCLANYLSPEELVGVDYSSVALKLCEKLFPGRYQKLLLGDLRQLEKLSLGPASFDAVVCSLSLMYLSEDDLDKCLKEVVRLLIPTGIFVFTYPTVSEHRAANPTANELEPQSLEKHLIDSGLVTDLMVPFCPLLPKQAVESSEDPATVKQARKLYEEAKGRMDLRRSYHWLYRGHRQ